MPETEEAPRPLHVLLISELSQVYDLRKGPGCCSPRTLALVEGQQLGAASLSSVAQVKEECLSEEMST